MRGQRRTCEAGWSIRGPRGLRAHERDEKHVNTKDAFERTRQPKTESRSLQRRSGPPGGEPRFQDVSTNGRGHGEDQRTSPGFTAIRQDHDHQHLRQPARHAGRLESRIPASAAGRGGYFPGLVEGGSKIISPSSGRVESAWTSPMAFDHSRLKSGQDGRGSSSFRPLTALNPASNPMTAAAAKSR